PDPTMAKRMTNFAIRTYHSADDPTVPVAGTRAMVAAIQEAGGNISYTEYDDLGHGCWSRAFRTADQVSWLFSQSKQADIPVEPICPLGDVDENGVVNATDALEVLKAVVGHVYLTYSQTLAADTDQNGTVGAADALVILQVVVGKRPPFNP
ncbi:MAG: hypothetical protein IKU10_05980, partial [Clostridia bacterium]|nr:hypothetical protein [Clostridia bacterium]